jgi:hypothetical protein
MECKHDYNWMVDRWTEKEWRSGSIENEYVKIWKGYMRTVGKQTQEQMEWKVEGGYVDRWNVEIGRDR